MAHLWQSGQAASTRRTRHAGDEVNLAAAPGRVVDDDVAVRTPPLRPRRTDVEPLEAARGKDGAVGDAAAEAGTVGPEQDGANSGMETVGADDGIGAGPSTVGETHFDPAGARLESDQFLVEVERVRRQQGGQRFVEVTPVHAEIGGAEGRLRHRQLDDDFAAVPDPVEVRPRRESEAFSLSARPRRRKTFIEFGNIWMPAPMRAKRGACS